MQDQDHRAADLAAYALGALDPEDRHGVEALLAESPEHQAQLQQLREAVGWLPYSLPVAEPPDHVRTRLFARLAATQPPAVTPVTHPAPRRLFKHPATLAIAFLATLVLILGGLTLNLSAGLNRLELANDELRSSLASVEQRISESERSQASLADQLVAGERQIAAVGTRLNASEARFNQISTRLAHDEDVIAFVSAPGVATRTLLPADSAAQTRGEMYMYPGVKSAVVLFSGLPELAPGQIYQFWLADERNQVAAGTFDGDPSGMARLLVEAPREVNAFREVMVTVEPVGGSPTPSTAVVLAGSL